MRKAFVFLLAAIVLLAGCSAPQSNIPPSSEPEQVLSSEPETTEDTTPSESPTTEETLPPHSGLYLEGLSTDAVILYFEEICLDAEIINSGNPTRLQRWARPILYQVLGDPTPEDLDTISRFAQQLNSIPGFPGIRESAADESPCMDISFCGQDEMVGILGDWAWDFDGGVNFWYEMDEIYTATICIRSDITQEIRNSVILEEIYNSLGPIQDTDLRGDSIIWSGYSLPQSLTEEDMLLLTLLYHPDLKPGMNALQCAEVIRKLYY